MGVVYFETKNGLIYILTYTEIENKIFLFKKSIIIALLISNSMTRIYYNLHPQINYSSISRCLLLVSNNDGESTVIMIKNVT